MEKYLGEYTCPWCGVDFTAEFGVITNISAKISGGGCSAVKCPHCGHNLKPIVDAKKTREIKEVKKRG